MKDPSGKVWKLLAEYREVRRPERLIFTWRWENDPALGETLVTVEFRRLGNSNFTEVKLRHEDFPTAQTCKSHEDGWIGCFITLDRELPAILASGD